MYNYIKAIAPNQKISYILHEHKEHGLQDHTQTIINSNEFYDLINKGCVKQKSHILKPPKNISNELLPHFLRGFFDGDGSIIKTKSKYNIKTDGYSYSINITTTKDMAEWI